METIIRVFLLRLSIFRIHHVNVKEATDKIKESLERAVKKRVVGTTDRPIACLLSGGLDSSIVTALVNKYYDSPLGNV